MNLLAGCTQTELFPSYPGMSTFTKGIYVPTRLLSLPEFSALEGETTVDGSSANIKISFIDTEGQGAVGTGYDMDLFSPALLCSRVIMYNRTGGLLTEEILSQLGMMTQAAQRLNVDSNTKSDLGKGLTTGTNGDATPSVNGTPAPSANGISSTGTDPVAGKSSSSVLDNSVPPSGTTTTTLSNGISPDSVNSPKSKGPSFGHLLIIFNQYRLNPQDNGRYELQTTCLLLLIVE